MQDEIITIRTLDCDICNRYDSVMLNREEILVRCKATDMGIGAYSVVHTDHTRIVYFDRNGSYLGDTIALSKDDIPDEIYTQPLPFYIVDQSKHSIFRKIRKKLFSVLHKQNLVIAVAGPSRAGKTSIVRYLETLVPEREATFSPSVPTMGKSVKRVKIGNSDVKTLDMGGQMDFWNLWEPALKEADAVFFILDGTSNNQLEIAQAFERVIQYRQKNTPILVVINKKDIVLRGEANQFTGSGEFLALTKLKLPIENVVAIEASVFEGIAYVTSSFEEIPLGEIISSFIKDFVLKK